MPASRDFGLGCAHVPVATDPKTNTLVTIPVPILGYCPGCSNKTGENLVAIPEWHRVNLPPDARKVYDEAPFYGGEYAIGSTATVAAVDDGAAGAGAGAPATAELSTDTTADDANPAAAPTAAPAPTATTAGAAEAATTNRIKYLSSATLEATYTYPSTFIATRQAWNHEFSTEAVAVELSGITKQPLEGSGLLVGMGGVESEHAGPSYERGWGGEGVEGEGGDGGMGVGVSVSTREQARVNGVKRMLDFWAGQAQFRRQMGRDAWAGEGGEGAVGLGEGEGEGEGAGKGEVEQEMATITIGYAGE